MALRCLLKPLLHLPPATEAQGSSRQLARQLAAPFRPQTALLMQGCRSHVSRPFSTASLAVRSALASGEKVELTHDPCVTLVLTSEPFMEQLHCQLISLGYSAHRRDLSSEPGDSHRGSGSPLEKKTFVDPTTYPWLLRGVSFFTDAVATTPTAPHILRGALEHGPSVALVDPSGVSHTYNSLLHAAEAMADILSGGSSNGAEMTAPMAAGSRIGIFSKPGAEFVASLWGTWLAGHVAVPLCTSHPAAEILYVLQNSVSARRELSA